MTKIPDLPTHYQMPDSLEGIESSGTLAESDPTIYASNMADISLRADSARFLLGLKQKDYPGVEIYPRGTDVIKRAQEFGFSLTLEDYLQVPVVWGGETIPVR